MSDQEFGLRMPTPYAQQTISKARHGNMSDPLALDVAHVLRKHGVEVDPGELLLVARAERERDARVKKALTDYLGKVLAPVLLAVAALGLQPPEAQAAGGDGRL